MPAGGSTTFQLYLNTATSGQLEVDKLADAISKLIGQTNAVNQASRNSTRGVESAEKSYLKATTAVLGYAAAIKTSTIDTALYASRTIQISTVMENLARVNGMNVAAVKQQADAIRDYGITTQESRNTINKMIGAQLDLSKSLDLTRLAQNAAKIEGISSSEALNRVVDAIASAQPEMLRTLGIQVSFENAYSNAAKAMNRQVNSLTDQEKTQIRLNAVLAKGPLIEGSYAMSLTTTAGQMQSLSRYSDELKNAIGVGLQPALQEVVGWLQKANKYALDNADGFQKAAAGVTALAVAGGTFAATSFLPLPLRGAVAGGAGLATYMLGDQDVAASRVEGTQQALKAIEKQKSLYKKQLDLGTIDDKIFQQLNQQTARNRELIRAQLVEDLAEIYKQRQAAFAKMTAPGTGAKVARGLLGDLGVGIGADYDRAKEESRIPWRYDLGQGLSIARGEIEAAMRTGVVKLDKSGLIPKGLPPEDKPTDPSIAKKAAEIQERVDKLVDGLRKYGSSEMERFDAEVVATLRELSRDKAATSQQLRYKAAAAEKRRFMLDEQLFSAGGDRLQQLFELTQQPTAVSLYSRLKPQSMQVESVDAGFNENITAQARQRVLEGVQRATEFEARRIELLSGPGGELDALNKITALRIGSLDKQKQLGGEIFDLDVKRYQLIQEKELRVLELRKQQKEEARQAGERLFDASVAGGQGLRSFISSQALAIPRKISGNLSAELFGSSIGRFQLPGLVGSSGQPNLLGRALSGTVFGIDPLKQAGDVQLTAAKIQLQAATIQAKGGGAAGILPGGGVTGTLQGILGGGGIFSGASGTNPLIFHAAGLDAVQNQQRGTRGLELLGIGTKTGTSNLARNIGIGGAIAGGAFGAYSGFSAGGVQGALTGIGSLAGTAGTLLGLAGVSGPAAPIVAGVGALLGIGSLILGDPKKKRAEKIDNFLEARRFTGPESVSREVDMYGRDTYYDMRGNLRSSGPVVVMNINAMDAKSFTDRRFEITEAVRAAVGDGTGAGLVDTLGRAHGIK